MTGAGSGDKVQPHHCQRWAIVYVRQSTMGQVHHHRESTERQYAVREWAEQLGWPSERIQVIDRDLGLSGAQAATRQGFQDLVARVSLGQVGAIFGLEVSRLARSSADLQRLLQLCALFDTLVVDADGIYDLRQVNDRLILGFKGTMSEAELSVLRGRLLEAKRHKASKGTLRFPVPVGYVWSAAHAGIDLDPDEEVRAAIHEVFRVFEARGTAYGVVKHFAEHQRRFPKRAYGGTWAGELRWGPLTHSRVCAILKNPSYTGTYVFGRYRTEKRLDAASRIVDHITVQPLAQWLVRLPDHHPAYITWAQYEQHQRQLRQNQTNQEVSGAAREGLALLQGLVLCGHCGRRMSIRYASHGGIVRQYECKGRWERPHAQRATCQQVRGELIDDAVGDTILGAATAEQMALTLGAWDRLADQQVDDNRQWRLALERAEYDAHWAQRQYDAADPENRLVTRSLESRWNTTLEALEQLQQDYAAAQATQSQLPTPADREFLRQLPEALPALWASAGPAARKRVIRCLIEDVTLTSLPDRIHIQIGIRWRSQRTDTVTILRRPSPWQARRHRSETIDRVRLLAETLPDQAIADTLNAAGQRTPDGRSFTRSAVRGIRGTHHIPAFRPAPPPNTWSVLACARHFGVSPDTVYTWIRMGLVPAVKPGPGLAWALTLDPATEARCRQRLATAVRRSRPRD